MVSVGVDNLLALSATASDNTACGTANGSLQLAAPWTEGQPYEVYANGSSMGTFTASSGTILVSGLNAGVYSEIYVVGADICGTDTLSTVVIEGLDAGATGVTPSTNAQTVSQLSGEEITYVDDDCQVIASINATDGDLGMVTTKAVVEASTGEYNGDFYLKRHFEITAEYASTPALVTLYVLESEIIDFNDNNGAMMDIDPQSGANLSITAFHSPEMGGGSGPDGHDADATELITPANFVYNAAADRYEITFETSGFSGFYISSTAEAPLNIVLGDVYAKSDGQRNNISWTSLDESSADYFEIQRSVDARTFETIARIEANGKASTYQESDNSYMQGLNHYRIVMYSQSGKKITSMIVSVNNAGHADFTVEAFPNQVSDYLTVAIKGSMKPGASITMTDINRRVVYSTKEVQSNRVMIPMHALPAGSYLIQYQDGVHFQSIKVTKK